MSGRRDLEGRLNEAACTVDGVAAILEDMVNSEDPTASRTAYALADLLTRVSADLSGMAVEARKATSAKGG